MRPQSRYIPVDIVLTKEETMVERDGLSLVVFAAIMLLFMTYMIYPRGTYIECKGQEVEVLVVPGGEIYVTSDGRVLYSC